MNQTAAINFSAITTPDICETTSGSIQLIAQGGTPPYKYDIGNGYQNKALFQNLIGGKRIQFN
ncbi:MAG: SprB repeat-containing protein [Saprospiraceae bacterium]|nr:SprB repeat-containing protein [Saprospiraceae bacterium]